MKNNIDILDKKAALGANDKMPIVKDICKKDDLKIEEYLNKKYELIEKENLIIEDAGTDPFELTEEEITRYSRLLAYAMAKAGGSVYDTRCGRHDKDSSSPSRSDFHGSMQSCRCEGVR